MKVNNIHREGKDFNMIINEGYNDYIDGLSLDDNPYRFGTEKSEEAQCWEDGFRYARVWLATFLPH